jgi:DNA-binding LytR/AlgR family response regulator
VVVLVAEDEPLIALTLEQALIATGHRVLGPVATIEEARQAMGGQAPDLALVNLTLQNGDDGAELARVLLARGTPTIFISADVRHARAHREVAIGLIKKPYDLEMIPAVLWYLHERVQGRQPDRIPPQLELFR